MHCLCVGAGSNPVVTAENTARSSNGSGCWTLDPAMRVRIPHGLLDKAKWWNLVDTRRSERRALQGVGVQISPWSLTNLAGAAGAQLTFIRSVARFDSGTCNFDAGGPVLIGASYATTAGCDTRTRHLTSRRWRQQTANGRPGTQTGKAARSRAS